MKARRVRRKFRMYDLQYFFAKIGASVDGITLSNDLIGEIENYAALGVVYTIASLVSVPIIIWIVVSLFK